MEVPAALARVLYSTEEARLGTFDRWPLVSKTATPKRLAQAGFFHNPSNEHPDRCTCFTCGVALMSWEPTDIPLEEHRRHAGHCEFINSRFPPGAARDDTTDDEEDVDGDGRNSQQQSRRTTSSSARRGSGVGDAALGASSSGGTTVASRWESSATRCAVRGGVAQDLLFGPLFGAGLRSGWTCCDNLSTSSEEGSRDDDSTEWEEGSSSSSSYTPPQHSAETPTPKGGGVQE